MPPTTSTPGRAARAVARRIVLAAVLAVVATGCAAVLDKPPSPTPLDFPGLAGEIALRGISLDHIVAGDAGCADPTLAPTAISFGAKGRDQATAVKIYVYIFRDADTFARRRADIDTCAGAYLTDPASFESIDASPYVATGQGPWGADFRSNLRAALLKAAGAGG